MPAFDADPRIAEQGTLNAGQRLSTLLQGRFDAAIGMRTSMLYAMRQLPAGRVNAAGGRHPLAQPARRDGRAGQRSAGGGRAGAATPVGCGTGVARQSTAPC